MGVQNSHLIEIFGRGDPLSLDARKRFRLPDALVDELRVAFHRVATHTDLSPDAINRLPFYFAPGTQNRIFLVPAPNLHVLTDRLEHPAAGSDPVQVRKARDYFYSLLRYADADRQNRLQIPDALQRHAGIEDGAESVSLICRGLWFVLCRAETEQQMLADGKAAFDQYGDDLLDPIEPGMPNEGPSDQSGPQSHSRDV